MMAGRFFPKRSAPHPCPHPKKEGIGGNKIGKSAVCSSVAEFFPKIRIFSKIKNFSCKTGNFLVS